MNVGIGLPSSVPGAPGPKLVDWAIRAEERAFSSLGVVDRVAYDCYDPFVVLAAAAAATQRIRLATVVVVAPLRSAGTLAKQALSLHALSSGRTVLGLSIGARTEDYDAAAVPHRGRGDRLEDLLFKLRDAFDDAALGPRGDGCPPLLVGGTADVAFYRAARFADGYVHGGGPPRIFARAAQTARLAWNDLDRPGAPVLWGQGYFALGGAGDRGRAYMRDYYAFTGPFAERIAEGLLTTPQDVVQFVRGYREAGCNELVLMPATSDLEQIDLLADVLEAAL